MARDTLKVWIRLDRVHCFDEGDGWGSAEPYLWPVFFKIDGATVTLTEALKLSGTATVVGTYGSHGNLGNTDVDAGETLWIPEALGSWDTTLKPIPVAPALSSLVADVAGVAGVVVVLMEEDNVSDSGAIAGYNALVNAIRSGLNGVIATLGLTKQEVTTEDIDAIQKAAETAVKDAIKKNQGFFANIWSWLNADDTIGSEVFRFGHDELADTAVINFNRRWKNEGDWQIFGHVNASVLCPAKAVSDSQALIGAVLGRQDMEHLRRFRDTAFPERPGLAEWWDLAERNAAALLWLFHTDGAARESLRAFAPLAASVLENPQQRVPDELVDHALHILRAAARSPARRLRMDAGRAAALLELARGLSVEQAMTLSAGIRPARRVTQREALEIRGRITGPEEAGAPGLEGGDGRAGGEPRGGGTARRKIPDAVPEEAGRS